MRGECWIRLPPSMHAEGGAGTGVAAGMLRTDQLRRCPAGSRTLPRGLGRTRGSAAEREEFIEDRGWGSRHLAGLCRTEGIRPGCNGFRPAAIPAASEGAQR